MASETSRRSAGSSSSKDCTWQLPGKAASQPKPPKLRAACNQCNAAKVRRTFRVFLLPVAQSDTSNEENKVDLASYRSNAVDKDKVAHDV